MNIFRKLIYMCAAVLTAILSVGCSQSHNGDEPDMPDFEEGIPTEVRITLSARSGNSQTRGDGDPKDPTSTVELIHDWWIAFIDRKGEVTVITRNGIPAQDRTTSTSVSVEGGGFEAETFRTIIPSGKYRIYAFANIPAKTADEIKAMLVEEKTPGVKDKISKHLKDFVTTAFINNNMQWPSDVNIPMSSIKEKTIKNTIEEAFNIEVIRAVAKMQFAFTNPSTDKIELNELKFGPITDSDEISIVPNNDAIGQKANDKLLNKSTNTLSFPSMGQTLEPEKGTYSFEFYCKESLGGWFDKDGKILKKEDANKNQIEHEDVFKIDLTVTKTKAGDTTGTEVTRTFYTKDITYINRNDWIYIPIKFNNWVIKWKLHYYPPIGGYPPVFNQDADGTSLQATLTTGGEFELYPVEVLMNGNSYKVDMNNTKMAVSVASGEDIFITKPQIMDNPNYNVTGHPLGDAAFPKIIAGELDPKKPGTATVKITFYLEATSGITDALDCTFTIDRKNGNP